MKERLIYTNERGESVEFSTLSVFHTNITKDVSGLSDVSSEIHTTSAIGQDGETYISGRIQSRDIEISGHINETNKEALISLRRQLNRVLNPHLKGKLQFILGDHKRSIDCRIVDAPRFKRKKVLEQFEVELLCLSPFWRDCAETRSDIAIWQGALEFPLELNENWEIGFRQPSLIVNVQNLGDVDTGFTVHFKALGSLTNPKILNVNTQEFIRLNLSMNAGDEVIVSTGYGRKAVTLLRGGVSSNAFRQLDPGSHFIQLAVGDNLFRYSADTNQDGLEVSIYHDNQYLGV